MATNNAVDTSLSGQTGTGNFVGANTPTLITPIIGAATGTSVTFSPTTGGIVGTTTNDSADAGKVGQFITSVIALSSAVDIPTATATNITSISLTAGDWDVWGNIHYAPITTMVATYGWVSSTSVTLPDASLFSSFSNASSNTTQMSMCVPSLRFSLSGTTTIYLSAYVQLSSSTCTGCGGIYARRVR